MTIELPAIVTLVGLATGLGFLAGHLVLRNDRLTRILSTSALLTSGAALLLLPASAQAQASAVACNETALAAAVNATNAAGGGVITLTPGCTYRLTTSHGNDGVHGPDGLPPITTAITFEGSANVITRSGGVFRIIQVSPTGNLTLKAVTVSNGLAVAGDGGGILNLGALTLTDSAVTGSTATGTGGGVQSGGGSAAATFTGSTLSGNSAVGDGGGLYNFGTATFTSSFVSGGNLGAEGGGIASVNGILSLTSTPVTANQAVLTAGGFLRLGGTLTVTTSPISHDAPNNCTGSVPSVPGCTA